MMNTISKACSICGGLLLTATNETTGSSEAVSCLNCMGKRSPAPNAPVNVAEDPGEGYFSGKGIQSQPAIPAPKKAVTVSGDPIVDALRALKSLPMPEDVKQFKKIKKIIALIEELQNAD